MLLLPTWFDSLLPHPPLQLSPSPSASTTPFLSCPFNVVFGLEISGKWEFLWLYLDAWGLLSMFMCLCAPLIHFCWLYLLLYHFGCSHPMHCIDYSNLVTTSSCLSTALLYWTLDFLNKQKKTLMVETHYLNSLKVGICSMHPLNKIFWRKWHPWGAVSVLWCLHVETGSIDQPPASQQWSKMTCERAVKLLTLSIL